MIKLKIFSKMMVEGIRDFPNHVLVISIGSPGRENAKIKGENVFFFQFHDIDTELFIEKESKIIKPVEKEIAESIVDIAFRNRDKKIWVIHCEAGVSRSPGVALGLARFIDFDIPLNKLEKQFPCYNRHVRKLIEAEGLKKMAEIDEGLKRDFSGF